MDTLDADIARIQEERTKKEQELAALSSLTFDADLYGGDNRFEGYERSIPVNNEDEEDQDAAEREVARKLASYTAPKSVLKELPRGGGEDNEDELGFKKPQRIIDREDDYRKRRLNRIISPDRNDAFAMGDKTPDAAVRTYADIMREEALKREKEETLRLIAKKHQEEAEKKSQDKDAPVPPPVSQISAQKRRNRWDQSQDQDSAKKAKTSSEWDAPDLTPGIGRWDGTNADPGEGQYGSHPDSFSAKSVGRDPDPRSACRCRCDPRWGGDSGSNPCRHDMGCHSQTCRYGHSDPQKAEVPVG